MVRRKKGARYEDDAESDAPAVRVPHDPVNEQVIIAAVIVDESARRSLLMSTPAEMFYTSGHAEIWLGLQELRRKGLDYDPATLRKLAPGADIDYVETLIEQRPALPPNLREHVKGLQFDHAKLQMVNGPLKRMLDTLRDPRAEPSLLRAHASSMAMALDGFGTDQHVPDPRELVESQKQAIEIRVAGLSTYPFGIDGLDYYGEGEFVIEDGRRVDMEGQPRLIPGSAPGKVSVVTGLSGSGKSTTTANMLNSWESSGRKVLAGVWEMGPGVTLELCASLSLGFSRTDVLTGRLGRKDVQELGDEMERMAFGNLKFMKLPFGKARGGKDFNDRVLDLIAQTIVDQRPEIFVADLFRRALKETDPDDEEQALYRMQAMAEELGVHFVLVQQQRLKDIEKTKSKRPTREGIKGSSAWVDIADTIIAWHRPAQWKSIPDDKIEAGIIKQRFGPWPLWVELDWDPEYGEIGKGRQIDVSFEDSVGEDPMSASWMGESDLDKKGKRKK